ncbi:MAG: glycosyltransferase family 4 protein [Yaniella sp.]|nr:glycosyltransferase family 4 protein [Yaniella sp.]
MSAARRRMKRFLNVVGLDKTETQAGLEGPGSSAGELVERTAAHIDALRNEALTEAENLWSNGHKISAFNTLREARLEYGPSAALQFEYGRKALEQGHDWAAREALHDAVQLDPTLIDALELFLEANRTTPAAKGSTTDAFTALAKLLPHSADLDVDAATLLLPSMSGVAVVDQKIRMLRYSENPVAQHIGHLAVERSEAWAQNDESDTLELLQAKLIIVLMRGEYDIAFRMLEAAPLEAKPKRALRLAIRKELRLTNALDARLLLKHYRKIDPDDVWSRHQLRNVAKADKYLSHYQLATKGFPFPKKAAEPKYTPDTQRVFYLLHNSLPHHSAGYATRTHGLLRGIRGHGWDVQGVTRLGYPYDMPKMESLGPIDRTTTVDDVPYHRLSITEGLEMKSPIQAYVSRYSKALQKLAKEEKPFILHAASNHWNGLTGVAAARRLGIPSIYEVRGLWEVTRGSRDPEWMGGGMYRYMARMEADAAANADRVITITNALREELINRGVDEHKITVVPNGVEVSRFKPRERNEDLAVRLGIQSKTVIGYVGSILDYEGLGLLIDAAHQLKQERDDVAFLLVGDGAELAQFRERVESEGLSDIVIFTGRVPHHEVEDYYSIIDICPFPRLPLPVCEMVSPLKPFEAMAMGKVVIASDVAALAEIVKDGSNGLLFEKGNAIALAQGLRRLLDNPGLGRQLSEEGRRWVQQERDWTRLSEGIGEIYAALGGSTQ